MKVHIPLHVQRLYFYRRVQPGNKKDCWLWPTSELNGAGYGQVTIRRKAYGKRRRLLSHRVSYRIYIGRIPKGLQVLHECDIKRCVNPHHLKVGTQLINEAGKVARGRSSRGEDRWCATLTNRQAQRLLDDYRSGESSIKKLAIKYKTTYWVAYSICNRTRWKYLI
jgi:hypothetical protein